MDPLPVVTGPGNSNCTPPVAQATILSLSRNPVSLPPPLSPAPGQAQQQILVPPPYQYRQKIKSNPKGRSKTVSSHRHSPTCRKSHIQNPTAFHGKYTQNTKYMQN